MLTLFFKKWKYTVGLSDNFTRIGSPLWLSKLKCPPSLNTGCLLFSPAWDPESPSLSPLCSSQLSLWAKRVYSALLTCDLSISELLLSHWSVLWSNTNLSLVNISSTALLLVNISIQQYCFLVGRHLLDCHLCRLYSGPPWRCQLQRIISVPFQWDFCHFFKFNFTLTLIWK